MLIQSNMLELGSKAADFNLIDANTNTKKTYQSLKGEKGTFIIFICNHCPYVKYIFNTLLYVFETADKFNISSIAINSNDVTQYPEDNFNNMTQLSQKNNFTYLYDDSQTTAKNYKAACTPDCYIFDENDLCIYRGRFDASTHKNGIPSTGADILYAIQSLVLNKNIINEQTPSIGCSIKWKN